ncbi:outer membrane protein assembly factor BamC [Methylobacter sp.]|uniref:outer membrane protein assembly factor BamC n=1 Tax=Methylobacter sp. TaxID=2051955 RepID=UPI00248772C3|nr:outer membrane protein assembly factor BamC [Methylobacter sp.]MDI1276389.1 outer membrane protein assembly factor BamC [Methylobacter sp.]MDI1357181.1 outer membrane protein assembly factor BamC [Methylobacter sp.]
MKTKTSSLIIVAVLVNVSACSTIKNLFPDKEKDYQFTTEIPPLIMPPDLAGDSIANVPAAAPAAEATDVAPAVSPTETAPTVDRKLTQVELVDAGEGTKRLRIGAPSTIAWRMVGKALSRKSIEVTNRNQDEGRFDVQYDPNKKEVEDESIWDEVNFFFKGFEVTEQEYVLKLVENNRQTDVVILDKEQKPVADETSLSLLTLLHDTIKADLAK